MRDLISPFIAYQRIEQLLNFIDEPNQTACKRLLNENRELFQQVQGSVHNHQAWRGGYIDHITDGMNFLFYLYDFISVFSRPLPFSRSDALLVFYLHDIEKPWKYEDDGSGGLQHRPEFKTRQDAMEFRLQKARKYGIELTSDQIVGIKYAEGIVEGYSNRDRLTNPLGAFVHMVDHWCARGWYDYPKRIPEDEWPGAGRFRIGFKD